jgi:simple sugar transport system permease protein
VTAAAPVTTVDRSRRRRRTLSTSARIRNALVLSAGLLLLLSLVRLWTDTPNLTSSGTFAASVRLAIPILLAALGALYAERAGIVNIGVDGMMVLGTWFGAWAGYQWGPWWGIAAGIAAGAVGGLLHALATVSFGVDHIISGVAINILAPGIARYLSVVAYEGKGGGGGVTQSPRVGGAIERVSLPLLSDPNGPELFGIGPDLLGELERKRWLVVSDVAGVLRGLTTGVSLLAIIGVLLVPLTWWLLWRTSFGLRLRSVGEHPVAAESLGVDVYRYKYFGVVISGALAGFGGAFLSVVAASIYREGQVAGRGFIGLAAMIFGNWRPTGAMLGAGLFGYADALQLRGGGELVHSLLLFVAILLVLLAAWQLYRRRWFIAGVSLVIAAAFAVWFVTSETVPNEFVFFTPHLITLLVLALSAQRLRPPAADGLPYRRGQSG